MVNKKRSVNIREIFLGLQRQMRAKLTLNRKILTHPVLKGDTSEFEWIDMLSLYLPKRYMVDKAFIIDCNGNVSDQIDIVIYDRHYSPFMLKQNGATYIPAESVYAIIEVKSELNRTNIAYAGEKAASVRKLRRTTYAIVHVGGRIDKPKKPFKILAGILTIDGLCTSTIKTQLLRLGKDSFLNFGCSLDKESFWFKKGSDGKMAFEKSRQDEGLVFFFLNLLSELQRLGSVPAMDIQSYINEFRRHKT